VTEGARGGGITSKGNGEKRGGFQSRKLPEKTGGKRTGKVGDKKLPRCQNKRGGKGGTGIEARDKKKGVEQRGRGEKKLTKLGL